jgi:DNA-binding NtrC family response regulator
MNNKILIVDDEQDVLNLVCKIVERAGFETACALNVADAMALFAAERPFLVITDLCLYNHVDGAIMASAMHRSDPMCIFIAISGFLDPFKIGYLLGSAFTDILEKPVSADTIVQVARYAHEKRDRWDQLLGRQTL